jgi:hypothetical protein
VTLEHTPEPVQPADELTTLRADVAALEFIFDELARAMDPAALLKVLTYLIRNAKRAASENQSYDSLEHRRLVAQVESLMARAEPQAKKQAMTMRNEHNRVRKEKARHQADSRRQQEGKR